MRTPTKNRTRRFRLKSITITDDRGNSRRASLLIPAAKEENRESVSPMAQAFGAFADYPDWDDFLKAVEQERQIDSEQLDTPEEK